ncbi:MAG TPA: hypothetical protein VM450_12490 [Thermomicrobiales bacterium]|nr:hypothetical protein [Thermomicrobiales bacterium]
MTKRFHHIGLPTTEPQPGESWVAATRTWVSNPAHHPQRVEWLRYTPESTADAAFQQSLHIAYTVDDLEAEIAGKDVTLGPIEVGEPPFARAAFTREDGVIMEYMQLYPGRQWFDDELD